MEDISWINRVKRVDGLGFRMLGGFGVRVWGVGFRFGV